ncbi:E3 ubiquitin-protein ligase PDZRN3-B-like [Myripristis murdjan]|uniref:E3 ubiquitin-protein ligase PDZRN3-B-like n=1 Tax=Myripristis murdjan TaxID=586833 RepID=UPI001175F1B8|nr:E3 ubiquitin-protein ligase PDZRN3-B-like [Myripristis murdjan]
MDPQTKRGSDLRDVSVCQKGCGLLLSRDDITKGNHCCLDALRLLTDALEERSAVLEHESRMARLRWGRREQSLLAQVSSLQSEAQLAALKYQQKLHQYMLNISSIAEQVISYYKSDLTTESDMQGQISEEATSAEAEAQEQAKPPEDKRWMVVRMGTVVVVVVVVEEEEAWVVEMKRENGG